MEETTYADAGIEPETTPRVLVAVRRRARRSNPKTTKTALSSQPHWVRFASAAQSWQLT